MMSLPVLPIDQGNARYMHAVQEQEAANFAAESLSRRSLPIVKSQGQAVLEVHPPQ